MARDAGGARVLEAFMEGSSKKKSKRLVMEHLEGLWAQMAEKASASHLVEKCFDRTVGCKLEVDVDGSGVGHTES